MESGILFSTFLVVFREALEAGLILGIILTVLARLNASRYFRDVIVSALIAVVFSFGIGTWLAQAAVSKQETAQAAIEIVISFVAAGILTYMFFWMESQARQIKPQIETHLEGALSRKDYWAVVSLPFFAVFREGAETVLFLKAVSIQNGGSVSTAGGFAGLAAAAAVTIAIFIGGKKIQLRPLFRVTGILVLLIAGGLLAYGIHELEEIHAIPALFYPLYNINHILNDKEGLGLFLKTIFGYNGNPSLTEVVAYWTYFAVIFWSFRKNKTGVAASKI